MKKKILFLTILLIFPFLVNAELNEPNQYSYDVNTNNEISLYNNDNEEIITIPENTNLTITKEKTIDEILYGYTEYENNSGYIKLDNITLNSKKYSTNSMNRKDEKKLITIASTDIYKGPSFIYDKIDSEEQIPKMVELTSYYYDDCWAFVDYNGVTGWIYIYSYNELSPYNITSTVGRIEKENIKIMTTGEVTLYKNPTKEDSKVNETIPEKTELEYKYYYQLHEGTKYIYVENDDTKGWFEVNYKDADNLAAFDYGCYSLYVTNDFISFYSKYNNINSKTSVKIPRGTELKIYYTASIENKYEWYYVKYKGDYGWVMSTQYSSETETPPFAVYRGTSYKYSTNGSINLYEKPNGKLLETTIPASTIFVGTYSFVYEGTKWIYTTYNNQSGWIKGESIKTISSEPSCINIDDSDPTNSRYDTNTSTNVETQNTTIKPKGIDYKDIISKVIVLLFIIVALVLVYLKAFKKNKKEIKQQEAVQQPIQQVQSVQNNVQVQQPVQSVAPVQPAPVTTPVQVVQSQPVTQPVAPVQQPAQTTASVAPVVQPVQPTVQVQPIAQPVVTVTPIQAATPEPKIVPLDGITNVVPIKDENFEEVVLQENTLFKAQENNDTNENNNV